MPAVVNEDLAQRVALHTQELPWLPSPTAGVDRRLLDRVGVEVARATSMVRYEAGSRFPSHAHEHGEEFYVLEGTFQDEHGDYPAGTYVRNPPGSSHAPYTDEGCTIFVKLRQFDPTDLERVVLPPDPVAFGPGTTPGLTVRSLHTHGAVHTALVRWAPGTQFVPHTHFGGEEILVLEGVFEDENGSYPKGTWIRSPHLSAHTPWSTQGCLIMVKVGHL